MRACVKWRIVKLPGGGHRGIVEFAIDDEHMPNVKSLGFVGEHEDRAVALGKAAAAAAKVQALLVEHPELQAIVPPGTALALKAIGGIAKSAIAGRLEEELRRHTGPAIRRLGKALHL